jgi:hypothetical protein
MLSFSGNTDDRSERSVEGRAEGARRRRTAKFWVSRFRESPAASPLLDVVRNLSDPT